MSNVSAKQLVPMSTEYAHLNQPAVQVNKPLEVSPSADSVSKFLKDSNPAQKESNVTVNKESLEKLFAMFEFALKAMRSLLAGMGVMPRLPGELQAQAPVKPGPDPRVVADAGVKPRIEPQMDAGTQVTPGLEAKVLPEGHTQNALIPDGRFGTKPATISLAETAQNKTLPSDINVTVQVQNCHCPHTGEKVAPPPGFIPRVNAQPSLPAVVAAKVDKHPAPESTVIPKFDTSAPLQPQVTPRTIYTPEPETPVKPDAPTPTTVEPQPDTPPTSDLTSPAPDGLEDDSSKQPRSRFARPGLRPRF